MNARHHHHAHEGELQQKRAELAALAARRAEAGSVLKGLRDELARFEQRYDQALGRRMAELERLEAEVSRRTGLWKWEDRPADNPFSGGWDHAFSGESDDHDGDAPEKAEPQDIKALYREVAKTIHPDLAGPGPSKVVRHELMSRANRAYAEDDRRTLQEILRKWRRAPDPDGGDGGWDLGRFTRQIARERQEIRTALARVENLKGSYVWRFKLRVEQSLARGVDLFAEMAAETDLDIARARRRLASLQGEKPAEPAKKASPQYRKLCFPELPCGTLFLRDRRSLNYIHWQRLGEALGPLDIEVDKAVRLDVREDAPAKLYRMQSLRPDDLQSLFLYEVGDDDLDAIAHLTGLEELYLSGERLSDGALRRIAALKGLKRIYLYQTGISDYGLRHLLHLPGLKGLTSSGNGITDQGLAGFQEAIPGVKTVSFKWER